MASTGLLVVWEKVLATPYVQSHETIFPGAVDVEPLNVQLIVLPELTRVQVSVSVGPVTPKFAVATVGCVIETTTDADAPSYVAVIVLGMVPPTTRVKALNVPVVAPAGTVTFAGSVTGSPPANVTTAPPTGAGPESLTVPEIGSPPATVVLATVIATSVERAVTVSVDDCIPLPFIDALMAAVPGATATSVKGVLDDPAATAMDAGTVATVVLLLVSAMVAPPAGAAALSVTVPCSLLPAARLGALSVTPAIAVVGLDGDVDEPPHCAVLTRAAAAATSVIKGWTRQDL